MAYTRSELFEHFEQEGYGKDKISQALQELGKIDKRLDPNAQEFDESIIERMEDIVEIIDEALTSSKRLPSADLNIVQQTAIGLAGDREIDLPSETFNSIIEILVGEQFVKAGIVAQLQEVAFKQALAHKERESLETLGNDVATRIQVAMQLVNEPQKLEAIMKEFGIKTRAEVEADLVMLNTESSDFDVQAFLAEVNPAKKSYPKTIADTKKLAKALLSSALK